MDGAQPVATPVVPWDQAMTGRGPGGGSAGATTTPLTATGSPPGLVDE